MILTAAMVVPGDGQVSAPNDPVPASIRVVVYGRIAQALPIVLRRLPSRASVRISPLPGGVYWRRLQQYARNFQEAEAARKLKPEMLVFWVKESEALKKYLEALGRSSMERMLNYYKANYPIPPYKDDRTFPPLKCRVLLIHGLEDKYLLPGALPRGPPVPIARRK
jgi:hypothetical protein